MTGTTYPAALACTTLGNEGCQPQKQSRFVNLASSTVQEFSHERSELASQEAEYLVRGPSRHLSHSEAER